MVLMPLQRLWLPSQGARWGMTKPFFVACAKAEGVDVAAKHLLHKLYEATRGRPDAWQVLGKIGERPETVARAVERGWLIVRDDGIGRIQVQSGLLTEEGRRLARKGTRA
jgi:hypothetical protein